jgi:hypothetical protein
VYVIPALQPKTGSARNHNRGAAKHFFGEARLPVHDTQAPPLLALKYCLEVQGRIQQSAWTRALTY